MGGLFAQLINDPGYQSGEGFTRGVNKKEAEREREWLFAIIRELVKHVHPKGKGPPPVVNF